MTINSKSIKVTLLMMFLMLATKIVSFVRDITLTNVYGASGFSDAFLVSIAIPTVLISGIMTALFTSYIPIYKEIEATNPEDILKYNTTLSVFVFFLSTVIVIVYFVFDDFIIRLFAAGFDDFTFDLTKSMSAIMIFNVYLMGLAYILQGYLQANHYFIMVSAGTIPLNLIITAGILISTKIGYISVPVSVIIGYTVYLIWFFVPARKKGFRFSNRISLKDSFVNKTLKMITPIFLGQIIFEINSIVDKSVASFLPEGSVTIMDYSFKVMTISYALIVNPIATYIFPKLSEIGLDNDDSKSLNTIESTIRIILLIMTPIAFVIVIYATPIVKILFFRGSFSIESVRKTTEALQLYSLSIVPISLRLILEKAFYAKQKSRIPMYNSMIGVFVNILLDFLLVNKLRHYGLAIATSASSMVTIVLFIIRFIKLYPEYNLKKLVYAIVKYFSSALLVSVVIYCINCMIHMGEYARLMFGSILFMVLYVSILVILRDEIVVKMTKIIKGRKKLDV